MLIFLSVMKERVCDCLIKCIPDLTGTEQLFSWTIVRRPSSFRSRENTLLNGRIADITCSRLVLLMLRRGSRLFYLKPFASPSETELKWGKPEEEKRWAETRRETLMLPSAVQPIRSNLAIVCYYCSVWGCGAVFDSKMNFHFSPTFLHSPFAYVRQNLRFWPVRHDDNRLSIIIESFAAKQWC